MKLFSKNILFILLIMMIMAGVYSLLASQMEVKNEIPISQIVSEINGGNIKSIGVKGDTLEIVFTDGKIAQSKKETSNLSPAARLKPGSLNRTTKKKKSLSKTWRARMK